MRRGAGARFKRRTRARFAYAPAAAAAAIGLRRSLVAEYSYLHTNAVNQAGLADLSGTTFMTNIAQGAGEADRRGNKIQLVDLRVQLNIVPKVIYATLTKAAGYGRFIVGMVKDTQGATRAMSTFLQSSGSAALASNSHWDEDKVPSQVTILIDQRIQMGYLTGEAVKAYNFHVKLQKFAPTTYNAATAAVADSNANHLFFQFIWVENSATDGVLYALSTKLKFCP